MTGSKPDFDENQAGVEEEDEELDSGPDSEDADRDSDEPPAPLPKPPQPEEDRWGIGSRVLALSSLLGCAVFVWSEFAYRSRWIADFLESNKLDSPEQQRFRIEDQPMMVFRGNTMMIDNSIATP